MSTLRVETVRPNELGAGECALWRSFQMRSLEFQHPFLGPEFAQAVDRVTDRARVAVLLDGNAVVGFLPYRLGAFGWAKGIGGHIGNRQAFVGAPGVECRWPDILSLASIDVLRLSDLVGVQSASPSLRIMPCSVVDLTHGWNAFLEAAKSHKSVKRALQRERKLERERAPYEFKAGVPDAKDFAQLITWKADRYRGSGHPNPFARAETRALLDVLSEGPRGAVRPIFSALTCEGRLVAADFSLTTDAIFAGWFCSHDPEYGQYAPGWVRMLRTIEFAASDGIERVDLSRGDEPYKESLKTGNIGVATGYLARPTARTAVFRLQYEPRIALESFVLSHPRVRASVRNTLSWIGDRRQAWAHRGAGPAETDTRDALRPRARHQPVPG
jgi:CelD/BcsL family acetyltransferase involved in cellulose biosynthesis